MVALGIDIGTSSLSAVVISVEDGSVLARLNEKNDYNLKGREFERLQDAEAIADRVLGIAEETLKKYELCAIGLSGQMHGIVYFDSGLKALSPLYTWQDMRGDMPFDETHSFAARLGELTGTHLASGYGSVTHFYNEQMGLVPPEAAGFCSAADFAAMRLCGDRVLTHSSFADSFGLYNDAAGGFDTGAFLCGELFPDVTDRFERAGYYKGIPVCVAVGDNQASFLGAVSGEGCALVNIGTGSQISVLAEKGAVVPGTSLRPLGEGRYILSGSLLCGGRAYRILADFLKAAAEMAGANAENIYELMERRVREQPPKGTLAVSTLFCGTRENTGLRGNIGNIGEENFTPEELIDGFIRGMAQELHELFSDMPGHANITSLIGSGNGVRKNALLRDALTRCFGLELKMTRCDEECAFGAALAALVAANCVKDIGEAAKLIKLI